MTLPIPRPAASGLQIGPFRVHVLGLTCAIGLAAAAVLFACGCGGVSPGLVDRPASPPLVERPASHHNRIDEEAPPRPRHLDVATPAQEQGLQPPTDHPHGHQAAAKESTPSADRHAGSLPPASAGTNGSFVPPSPSQRRSITPQTMAALEPDPGHRAVLLGGVALAPPSAPEAVKAAISGANQIVGRPYVWGGGHSSWYSKGYDCSGSVSYALAAGGLLSAPLTSGELEHWGAPGRGQWITVYANAGHTYAVIAGLRWDTVGDARGTGPRWHAALPYPNGFVARHPPGY